MDVYEAPKACPIVSGSPLRWSVAFHRRQRRVIVAWFETESAALDFLEKSRDRRPDLTFDCLQALF